MSFGGGTSTLTSVAQNVLCFLQNLTLEKIRKLAEEVLIKSRGEGGIHYPEYLYGLASVTHRDIRQCRLHLLRTPPEMLRSLLRHEDVAILVSSPRNSLRRDGVSRGLGRTDVSRKINDVPHDFRAEQARCLLYFLQILM